ncbi:MAG: CBS domain-containing protein [Planctomycetota bacterium]
MTTKSPAQTESVQSIMSASVQTIDYRSTVADAVQLMAEDQFNAIPVVDGDGKCVGMLSRSDLTETFLAEDQELANVLDAGAFGRLSNRFIETCDEKSVVEVMTHDVMSVSPTTAIKAACEIMTNHQIHHLPVISDRGFVEGIVSSFDVIRWLANDSA